MLLVAFFPIFSFLERKIFVGDPLDQNNVSFPTLLWNYINKLINNLIT